jgi:S-formylglutathione hydrolase FrmB
MLRQLSSFMALALLLVLSLGAQAADVNAINLSDGNGLHIVSSQVLDNRTMDIVFSTSATSGNMTARITVPDGYATSGQTYPVLYLLHGGLADHNQWTDLGAEQQSTLLPLIIVQPDGGGTTWYADALSGDQIETWIVGQLLPWVDSHLRTWNNRDGRAIAGLSMGGYGAMSYAARHNDVFSIASSYSGAVDINNFLLQLYTEFSPVASLEFPGTIFGIYPSTQEQENVAAHNPLDLAANLSNYKRLAFYNGNGESGPLDPPGQPATGNIAGFVQEEQVFWENVSMDDKLAQLGISHIHHQYGTGMHMPLYWTRDLRKDLPFIMNAFDGQAYDYGNVLTDGNFEDWNQSSWACNGGCGVDENLGNAQTGANNGWARGTSGWNALFQTVNVTPNQTYHLSGWIHTSPNATAGYFGVRTVDGQVIQEIHFAPSPSGYTYLSEDVNMGSLNQAQVYAGVWANGDTWLQADNIALVRNGGTPPANNFMVRADGNFEDVGMGSWTCVGGCGTDHGIGQAHTGGGNGWARANGGWNDIHTTIRVIPNRSYTLSGWVRTSGNPHDGFFGMRTENGVVLGEAHYTGALGGYAHLTVTVNSGDNSLVDIYNGVWANGDTWTQLDDVSLTLN